MRKQVDLRNLFLTLMSTYQWYFWFIIYSKLIASIHTWPQNFLDSWTKNSKRKPNSRFIISFTNDMILVCY